MGKSVSKSIVYPICFDKKPAFLSYASTKEFEVPRTRISTFDFMGFPNSATHTIFLVSLFSFASPYLSGLDFGAFRFPNISQLGLNLKLIGPILFVLCVAMYIPIWSVGIKAEMKKFHLMPREKLRSGLQLGWQLGRYELIWDSKLDEAQQIAPQILDQIRNLIRNDNLSISDDKREFREIMELILSHYVSTDLEKHAAVLVGNSAMRVSLVGASKQVGNNDEMKKIALSSIKEVDATIIPNANVFFENVMKLKPQNISEILKFIDSGQLRT